MITTTREEMVRMIETAEGKFFTVTFIKKDNSIRIMNARLGVKKHLHGGSLPYTPKAKGLIPVYDIQKKHYKMINRETVMALKIDGKEYQKD